MVDETKPVETEAIDRLFLELSQFTRATTARERKLEDHLVRVQQERNALHARIAALPPAVPVAELEALHAGWEDERRLSVGLMLDDLSALIGKYKTP